MFTSIPVPLRAVRSGLVALIAGLIALAAALVTAPPQAHAFGSMSFPVAVLDASSTYVKVGEPIAFDGSRSYGIELSQIQQWGWDFGDGTSASGPATTHAFTTPGMKTVTLTVTDQYGTSDTETRSIAVWDYPTATITATPTTGRGPLTVSFTSTSDPAGWDTQSQVWDFGDGTTASGATATHTYSTPGSYRAAFTLTNVLGWATTAYQQILVTEPMAAPSNLAATSPSRGNVRLSWTNRMTTIVQTEVQRCSGSKCTAFTTVAYLPNTATTFTEGGLRSGTTFRYRLKVTDIAGAVGVSNIASTKVR